MFSVKTFLAVSLMAIGSRAAIAEIRQVASGTDLYNCHDNCGQAILEVKAKDDVCNDDIFLTDYANCLLCAAEDKDDIWKYYGTQLTSAAAACGLSTAPTTGTTTSTIESALPAETAQTEASSNTAAATTTASPAGTTGTTDFTSSVVTATASPTTSPSATASTVETAGASAVYERSGMTGALSVLGAIVAFIAF